jgi:ArsR family transcriptional regulator, arsenate/arsenite/antimonite-responsive transcriptional repressor
MNNPMNNEAFALISKALSDPNRLQIIGMITEQERCACKLLEHFNISQPTLSHHMRILMDSNLLRVRKEGKWSHYSINVETLEAYRAYVELLYQETLNSSIAGDTSVAC